MAGFSWKAKKIIKSVLARVLIERMPFVWQLGLLGPKSLSGSSKIRCIKSFMNTNESKNSAVQSPTISNNNGWESFISAGFLKSADENYAQKFLEKNTPTNDAKENELDIFYRYQDGIKYFTVCCLCGNSRMILHENGVRCHSCGRFHSHDNYNRMKLKVSKLARWGDGRKEVKPQPFIAQYNKFKRKLYVHRFRKSLQQTAKR